MNQQITQLPKYQRPREKLMAYGPINLSNAELLALILSNGTQRANALKLAKTVLSRLPDLLILTPSLTSCQTIQGIGPAQASKLVALSQLCQRSHQDDLAESIQSPTEALRELRFIRQQNQEYLVGLYLNARHQLIDKTVLAVGRLNQLQVEPRDIFSPGFIRPAQFMILAHNHPSGDTEPSEDDIKFTQRVSTAGQLVGLQLVDHLIVTKTDFCSIRELGLMEGPTYSPVG